ncbi:DciA family protein, partial [Kitasatospora sp. NPDC001660]
FADLVLRDPGADVPVLLVEVDRENEGVGTLVEKLATYRAWCELPAKGHREGRVRNEHAPPRRPHPRPAGTVGGGLRDHWLAIVGPDAAAHWHLAGYDPTTRRLRVVADSPAWAAQLRLHHRRILTDLEQLRPGTVRAIDVRVGPAPVVQHNQDPDDRPARRDTGSAAQPARPPLADHAAYQELRRRMREAAAARQAALDEAAAEREAILRRNYNRLREPEQDHRPSDEDQQARARAAHARELLARHRAALAVARGNAIPLRTARQPRQAPARGAA